MPFRKPLAAAAIALGFTFGGAAPLFAQAATEAPESPEAAVEAPDFSEEKLDAFVAAAEQVGAIQQRTAQSLAETQDRAEQDAMIEQANAEMVGAIDQTPGITVEEYVQIAQAAEADPELGDRLQQMLAETQSD